MSVIRKKKSSMFGLSKRRSEGIKHMIMRAIYSSGGRWLTTNQVAKKSKTNWATATAYLDVLFDEGYVTRGKSEGGQTCWKKSE